MLITSLQSFAYLSKSLSLSFHLYSGDVRFILEAVLTSQPLVFFNFLFITVKNSDL